MASDKKIEDYLPYYLGCECMVVNHFKSIVIGIHTNGNIQVAHAKSNQTFWEAYYIKPILRKLSDMSEEEFNYCHKKGWTNHSFNKFTYTSTVGVMEPEEFLYLLSIGIDLFNLIDAGIALDKTKI